MHDTTAQVRPVHDEEDASTARPPCQRNAVSLLPGASSLAQMMQLMGLGDQASGLAVAAAPLRVLRVQPGGVLLDEASRSGTLYVVRSGGFKCLRMQEDGYEQVLTFAQAGDLLGAESLYGGNRRTAAAALETSTVFAISHAELQALQRGGPLIDDVIRHGLGRLIARAVETAEIMVAVASEVRLARFVLWLSARKSEAGQSTCRLHLGMGRRDIASMLGVAHETVSRSFTALADAGILRVDNREVEIRDMAALRARARCTRPGISEHRQRPVAAAAPGPARPAWWLQGVQGAAPQPG